jgi:predicted 2-oxoglutarate/Fe(II)-dependent dioxygenase YbiX
MVSLKDFVVIHKNIMPEELCNAILSEYANSDDWREASLGSYKTVNHNIRHCSVIPISIQQVITKNEVIRRRLDGEVFQCASNALEKYKEIYNTCSVSQDTGYELLCYQEGQFFIEHTDSSVDYPREISCSFILNDNFDGGEFAFFNRELKYKIPKGSAIMFPSNFMFPHEIMKVTSGIRYSIITWFK